MTVSIGAAGLTERIKDTDIFIKESDTALYRAKEQGRNRVAWRDERQAAVVKPGINYQV